jgi:hypothetical protein
MIDAGLSPSFADAITETAHNFNDGEVWERRTSHNITATTLGWFAADVFAKAYAAAANHR